MWLFVAFLTVPLLEIALFIQIGGVIGLWPTLGIVILTAALGTWLVRSQGAMAMNDIRRSFNDLSDPTEPIAHGAMILIAGALLLTPGFFTDAVGFALLMPPVRKAVMQRASKHVKMRRFEMGTGPRPGPGPGRRPQGPHERRRHGDPDVIDGDYTDVSPAEGSQASQRSKDEAPHGKRPTHPGSGWTKH
ncbi:phage T7 F exclusion suppressor FxsA [Roseivivax jejudonensis]|uniref:Phage T7 F exclusion suppressor FxsA n=1 Tax=Roseivivax jejudonensis TaxID=1529041 RepID=A0A1X6ZNH0_9RHOB|nr:FxsA family protein [Roseivivax jejudonensis]SLN56413.1 phage T7 F exclusion suppressor FxsA [Roseivivax jejudonensis]